MKILFLTRRFIDGDDVSEYVKALAEKATDKGHKAVILAFDDNENYTVDSQVKVERVPLHYEGDSLYSWSMMLNNEMKERARKYLDKEDFDIVHANDWLTVPGATAVGKHFEKPIVLTVHSTENQRGFDDPHSEVISEMEWKGCKEADKILVNSEDTYNSLKHDLDVQDCKIQVLNPLASNWQDSVLNTYEDLLKTEDKLIGE